jgi:hypothetical protein
MDQLNRLGWISPNHETTSTCISNAVTPGNASVDKTIEVLAQMPSQNTVNANLLGPNSNGIVDSRAIVGFTGRKIVKCYVNDGSNWRSMSVTDAYTYCKPFHIVICRSSESGISFVNSEPVRALIGPNVGAFSNLAWCIGYSGSSPKSSIGMRVYYARIYLGDLRDMINYLYAHRFSSTPHKLNCIASWGGPFISDQLFNQVPGSPNMTRTGSWNNGYPVPDLDDW